MKFPNAKIIAIEPEESNFNILSKNVEKINNIYPLKAGIWKKKCNIKVKDIGLDKYGFIIEETDKEEGIKAETIFSIMEKFNIDYIDILKIDIEGSEKEVFEENFEWMDKVGILIIELHDRMKRDCSKTFFNAISKYNYELEIRGENLIIRFIK